MSIECRQVHVCRLVSCLPIYKPTSHAGMLPLAILQDVSVALSVLTLTAISLERFFAICHPFGSQATTTTSPTAFSTRRARWTLVALWIASLVVMSPGLVVMDTHRHLPPQLNTNLLTTCKPVGWSYGLQAGYQLFITFALYVVPLGLITVAYVSIAKTLWFGSSPNHIEGKI